MRSRRQRSTRSRAVARSVVEIHGGDHRLERVGEDRLLGAPAGRVFTLAEQQVRAEVDLLRDLGEHARVHDAGAHLGELAFGQVGKVLEHVVRDDEAEHGVAEELEALVRLRLAVLRAPRPVRERARAAATRSLKRTPRRRLERGRAARAASASAGLDRRGHDRAPGARGRRATHSTASRTVRHSTRSSSSIASPTMRSPSSASTRLDELDAARSRRRRGRRGAARRA